MTACRPLTTCLHHRNWVSTPGSRGTSVVAARPASPRRACRKPGQRRRSSTPRSSPVTAAMPRAPNSVDHQPIDRLPTARTPPRNGLHGPGGWILNREGRQRRGRARGERRPRTAGSRAMRKMDERRLPLDTASGDSRQACYRGPGRHTNLSSRRIAHQATRLRLQPQRPERDNGRRLNASHGSDPS